MVSTRRLKPFALQYQSPSVPDDAGLEAADAQRFESLIVEDEALIAMEMADAVAAADGVVVGPFTTVRAALRSLQQELVGGAILDANLSDRDITPVALFLAKRGIPAVVYTGVGLPAELRVACPDFPVVLKASGTDRVIDRLSSLMGRGPAAG